jgi:enoyl-CoA hydratase
MSEAIPTSADPFAWLTFDNPARHNAMSLAMWDKAHADIRQFQSHRAIRAVVMRGAGTQAFVSGADISQFDTQRDSADAAKLYALTSDRARASLSGLTKPLIAMIHGYCFGAGVDIALRADLRVAADDAVFCIPAGKLGLAYGFDSIALLDRLIGPSHAKDLLFTGRRLNADDALRMGLVNYVFPASELLDATTALARTIADNAPLTLASAKLCVDQARTDPGRRDMGRVDASIEACFDSEDYREGRRAFKEKRRPVFHGH